MTPPLWQVRATAGGGVHSIAHDLAPLAGLELHQVGRASIAIPGDAAGCRARSRHRCFRRYRPALARLGIVGFDDAAGHRRFWRCGISLRACAGDFSLGVQPGGPGRLDPGRGLGRPAPGDEGPMRGQHHIDQDEPRRHQDGRRCAPRRRLQAGQPSGQGSIGQAVAVAGLDHHRALLLGSLRSQDAARNLVHRHAALRRVEVRAVARFGDKRPVQVDDVELEVGTQRPAVAGLVLHQGAHIAIRDQKLAALAPQGHVARHRRAMALDDLAGRVVVGHAAHVRSAVHLPDDGLVSVAGRLGGRTVAAHDRRVDLHHGRHGGGQQLVAFGGQLGQQLGRRRVPVLARLGRRLAFLRHRPAPQVSARRHAITSRAS